jgi:peptidoglycan/LPS O-acetylase OafA/YrhL
MTSSTYQNQHLRSLTGLRFLAAFSVFVAHVGTHWPNYRLGDLPLGAAGVGFFYVLSGFILTYVYGSRLQNGESNSIDERLLSEEGGKVSQPTFSFREFYVRRLARIWPLHLATLVLTLVFVRGVGVFFNQPQPIGKLLANGLLVQSWIPNGQWVYSLNGPSWSLAVEAFFYGLFPFLLLGGPRRFTFKYLAILAATVLSIIGLAFWVPEPDSWIQLNFIFQANPLLRCFEFATGVGCGFLMLNRDRAGRIESDQPMGSTWELATTAAVVLFFATANWTGMYAPEMQETLPLSAVYWFRFCGAAPVFALVVFVFAQSNGLIGRFFSSRLMVYLGETSYSFYMVHMGVILVLTRIAWEPGRWVTWGSIAASFAISLFLAAMLYHVIEIPFRRWIAGKSSGQAPPRLFNELFGSVIGWLKTPWFALLLLAVLGSSWFISSYRFDVFEPARIESIVDATDLDLLNTKFAQDAVLLGVRTTPTASGGLKIDMAWKLNPGRRAVRFMKLLDSKRQEIGRGDPNRHLFEKHETAIGMLDRVELEADALVDVAWIAIGFFAPERKAAEVDRGPRSARNRQLEIWKRD